MNITISMSKAITLLLAMLIGMSAYAQKKEKLTFLDAESKEPIVGLYFQYAKQSGASNENGQIELYFTEGEGLILSHINYGKWQLKSKELSEALISEEPLLKNKHIEILQPVSVISLRPNLAEKDQQLRLNDTEKIHHDAGAVLTLNPGINAIRKSPAFGFDPVMRGFKYDQLNVVIDGLQSASAACPNRMDPGSSQIMLNQIKKVEILKGPHALRYGNAFGTINFVSESPLFTPELALSGRASALYETNGNVIRNEAKVGLTSAQLNTGLLFSYSTGNDYKDGNGNSVASDFQRGSLGAYLHYKPTGSDLFSLTVNRNFARDVDFPTLGMDLRTDDTWMLNAAYEGELEGQFFTKWVNKGYYTKVDHLMDNLMKPLDPRLMNASTPAETENYGYRSELQKLSNNAQFFLGLDYKSESAEGERVRELLMGPNAGMKLYDNPWQKGKIDKSSLFSSYSLQVDNHSFHASGRIEYNRAQSLDSEETFENMYESTTANEINPAISLGFKTEINDNLSTAFWLARAQRSAGLTERYINYFAVGVDPYELLGNPGLSAEKNNQIDWVISFDEKVWQSEVNFFASYLTDYIGGVKTELQPKLMNSPGVRQFVNIGEVFKTGFEFNFNHMISESLSHSVQLAYTYAENLSWEEPLAEIAPLDLRYAISANLLDDRWRSSLNFRFVDRQNRVSAEFGEVKAPSFYLIGLESSFKITEKWHLKAGANNLLDQAYYEHLNRPILTTGEKIFAPGRNFYSMLIYRF
ncbi:TonB-dependent receptor domain-containing protein [Marivirga harenae]|uniref:TonB-dependent receptor domain-containing protein n=1 Tax=Marivirga harenae TaxID=2010992 RepID=UPI0026DEE4C9|nr:TonB-dependent receptor [Marivirga harenae]WKV12984.1 TonB-dependent receptor [Marivirga harenae]